MVQLFHGSFGLLSQSRFNYAFADQGYHGRGCTDDTVYELVTPYVALNANMSYVTCIALNYVTLLPRS